MQRVLLGVAAVAIIAAVVVGVYAFSGSGPKSAAVAADAPQSADDIPAISVGVGNGLPDPMGTSKDPNDPGEQHFRHGRYPEAIAYWTEQAAKGNVQAAHRLGVEYMDGKPGVVDRDYAKAVQYHRQAAMGGKSLSMFDLGSLYEFGNGVEKDIAKAARWYGHSADYGLAQGQYNYAIMLENGEGVAKDEIESLKFYILAARGGFTGVPYNNQKFAIDQNAATPVEVLQQRLSKANIDEARSRADAFTPQSGPLKSE